MEIRLKKMEKKDYAFAKMILDTLDLFSSLAYLSCAVLFCLIDLVVIELVTFSYHARITVYGLEEV